VGSIATEYRSEGGDGGGSRSCGRGEGGISIRTIFCGILKKESITTWIKSNFLKLKKFK